MSGSVLTGDMGSIPLPDILMLLNGNRKTGRLCCSRAGVSKTVEYEAGDVVFARSTLPEDRLGAYLLAHGKVTKQQLQKAGPKVDSQVRLGKTLVRLGILTPSALWEAVQGQVLEIVYSLFHWNDGSFEFLEGDSSREKISVKTSMMNLILEGTRRLDEWSQVRERIQNDQIVLSPHKSVAEAGGKVKLSNPERRVLGLVDGRRTVREVVDVAGLGEFEAWQALNALLSAGFIRVQLLAFDQPEAAEDKAAAPGDDSALDLTMDRYGEAVVEILGRAEQAGLSDVVARVR